MTVVSTIFAKTAGRLRKMRARMRRDRVRGSAAIEFGIIAPVFFILLMGIIENGVIFFAGSTLQYATDEAARWVRTGQASTAGTTQAQFRTLICNNIAPLLACDSNLQVDLQSSSTGFTGAGYSSLRHVIELNPAPEEWHWAGRPVEY